MDKTDEGDESACGRQAKIIQQDNAAYPKPADGILENREGNPCGFRVRWFASVRARQMKKGARLFLFLGAIVLAGWLLTTIVNSRWFLDHFPEAANLHLGFLNDYGDDFLNKVWVGDLVAVESELKAGEDPNKQAPAHRGNSALVLACYNGQTETAQLLLKYGADINRPDGLGTRAIHAAVHGNHLKTTKTLLAAGAEINATDRAGTTPLHMAIGWGHGDLVKFLLDNGADPNAEDLDGWMPIQVALSAQKNSSNETLRRELVQMLLNKGADPLGGTGRPGKPMLAKGFVPLEQARQNGWLSIVPLLTPPPPRGGGILTGSTPAMITP